MSKPVYDTKYYEVVLAVDTPVMNEAGAYEQRDGYLVINKKSGVVEHTTMILPQAIYQAQGFSDSLVGLLETDKKPVALLDASVASEDVVPN